MIQGAFGSSGAYSAYGTHIGYKTGNNARAEGSSGGGAAGQLDPIARVAAAAMPIPAQTAAREPAAQAMPTPVAASAALPMQTQPSAAMIPDAADNRYMAPELAVRGRILPFAKEGALPADKVAQSSQAIKADGMEQLDESTECQTCKERKYQDESGDGSVSFQNPQSIDKSVLTATVRGHEMEHVQHEQAKAVREGRKVVSQSVTLHTAICPDCGDTYVSGGTTRTVTMADNSQTLSEQQAKQQAEEEDNGFLANMLFPA